MSVCLGVFKSIYPICYTPCAKKIFSTAQQDVCFGIRVSERGQLHLAMTGCSGYNPVLRTQEFVLLKGSHTQNSTVKFPKKKKTLSPKPGCFCQLTEPENMNTCSGSIA